MTKDELKKLYDAKIEAEKGQRAAAAVRDESFESDLAYQIAGMRYGRAVNAYDDAIRLFAAEQVAA